MLCNVKKMVGFEPIESNIIEYFQKQNINIFNECLVTLGKEKIEIKLKEIYESGDKIQKIIIFILDDYEFELSSYSNQIIVRSSADKSLLKFNEVVLPFLWSPVFKPFEPLLRKEKPIVGFCGWRSKYRYEILKAIRTDARIQENYIIRDKFMGGHRLSDNTVDDFDNNMKESHFIICNRGTGNFSMRFFQTLASGRIPIVVNSDMQLPLHGVVSYDNVIIMENSVEKVIERLLWVWNNRDIVEMQRDCSKFYDDYLHYENYGSWLHKELSLKGLL
jgi:hypothetical protein